MRLSILASIAMLSVFSTAHAKVIFESGAWSLDDLSDKKKDPNGLCLAYTQAEIGSSIYRLEIAHPKNKNAPTEIQLRLQGKPGALGWTATLNDGSVMAFANSGTVGKQTVFWNIPQSSIKLFAQLEDKKDIKFKPADGSKDIKLEFDADGFKKVREKMEEKCLNKTALLDSEFEASFLTRQDSINPLNVSSQSIVELKKLFAAGYDVHLNILANRDDMARLRLKFKRELDEADALNSLISRLAQSEIPSIIQAGQRNDSLEVQKKQELTSTISSIAASKSNVAAAEKNLAAAKATIAPFEKEHSDRANSAYYARQAASSGANRLAQLDQGIAQAQANVAALSNEAGRLQESNSRLEAQIRSERMDLVRAERDDRAFNPREDVSRRLHGDRAYNETQRMIPGLKNSLSALEKALAETRGKAIARDAELKACQNSTASVTDESSFRLPAQERGPRHNRPDGSPSDRPQGERPQGERPTRQDPPTTPTTPVVTTPEPTPVPTTPVVTTPDPTTPARDCSVQIEALRVAKVAEADVENQVKNANDNLRRAEGIMSGIQERVEREANEIERTLRTRVISIRSHIENLAQTQNGQARRVYEIANRDIPSQQAQESNYRNERQSVQAQYDADAPNANRLEGELASFESRVGWSAKVTAVQNTTAILNARSTELRNFEYQKSNIEGVLAGCLRDRAQLNASLAAAQRQKADSENRLVQVKKSLEPFEAEKSSIDGKANDLKNQLAGVATQFESNIK